ncbi:MAG: hypothetical protein IJM37_11075 [Lachnospiraceae bacterium]|nr:hypothetical protein [Lachnospiraceae bacterium]
MKKSRFSKVLALFMTLVMTFTLSVFSNVNMAKAANVTVTFRNGSQTVDTKTVSQGSAVSSIGALEQSGKLFAGWFTRNNTVSTQYAYNFSSAVNSNTTLYAGWIDVGSSFNLLGVQYRPVTDIVTAGLRFMTKIDDSLVNAVMALNSANSVIRPSSESQKGIGYGTVVTYTQNLKHGEMLVKDNTCTSMAKGFKVVPGVKTYQTGTDYRIYTVLITGIPERYYTQHIAARPYITYADANGYEQTYYYTEASETTHKAGGAYYINYTEAVNNAVDDDALVIETETQSSYTPVYTGGYDLAVTDITWTPANPTPGSSVVFSATIINDGDTAIPAGTTIGYQVQIDGNNSNITWCDSYNGGLAAGQSITLTCNGGTNGNAWSASEGSHSVMAWVDDVNRFPNERNENNNQYTKTINVTNQQTPTQAPETQAPSRGYDLIVTDITCAPSNPTAGSNVLFTATVKNDGDTAIPAGEIIGYQIQIDGNTGSIFWCDSYTGGLAAGESKALTCNGGTNGAYWNATQGSHSVMAWVDDVNRFANEYNENNNQYTKTFNVTQGQTQAPETQAPETQAPPSTITVTLVDGTASQWLSGAKDNVTAYFTANGVNMTKVDETHWTATINETDTVVFRRGPSYTDTGWNSWNASGRGTSTTYTATGDAVGTWGTVQPVTQAPETQPSTVPNNTSGITIYFYGQGWSSAYLWAWDGYTAPSWPGAQFTKVNGDWWKLDVNASGLTGYVQETGNGRGCDKNFGHISGYGTYFVVFNNNSETLYTSQSQAEAAAGASISGGSTQPETQGQTQPETQYSGDGGRVIGYNVPSGKTRSSNVSMTANGVSVGVFDTTVNNSHTWVGYNPPLSSARVAIFDFEGAADVVMTVNYSVNSATIRPLADGVTPTVTRSGSTTTIRFRISHVGQYSVELNGNLEDAIMIFASAIESAPTGNVRTISGEYNGDITVTSGQTLYIEGGAAIYGRVFCQSNSNVAGRGIIDGSKYGSWGGDSGYAKYPMSIENCSNVHVSGVSVLNSNCWNYQIYNANQVYLDNIKIVSARPNGDGVSIQSSSNVHVNNSFIRTWDDGVVLKNYSSNNTHDVYCDNVVFWTDLAQSMEIGVETNAGYAGTPSSPAIYNVEFTNIDVIHERHKAAISIHNGDNANIYNIKWENVNVEDFTTSGDGWNYWLDFTTCYPTDFGGSSAWAHHWDGTGTIHGVTLKNINVTSSTNAGHRVWDYWASQNRGYSIYDITVTNVKVNGSDFQY